MSEQSNNETPEIEIATQEFIKALRNLDEMHVHTFRQIIQSVAPENAQPGHQQLMEAFDALYPLWSAILSEREG